MRREGRGRWGRRGALLAATLVGLPVAIRSAVRVARLSLDIALLLVALVTYNGEEPAPVGRSARHGRPSAWAAFRAERALESRSEERRALAEGFAAGDARYHAAAAARHRARARRHLWRWLLAGDE